MFGGLGLSSFLHEISTCATGTIRTDVAFIFKMDTQETRDGIFESRKTSAAVAISMIKRMPTFSPERRLNIRLRLPKNFDVAARISSAVVIGYLIVCLRRWILDREGFPMPPRQTIELIFLDRLQEPKPVPESPLCLSSPQARWLQNF